MEDIEILWYVYGIQFEHMDCWGYNKYLVREYESFYILLAILFIDSCTYFECVPKWFFCFGAFNFLF